MNGIHLLFEKVGKKRPSVCIHGGNQSLQEFSEVSGDIEMGVGGRPRMCVTWVSDRREGIYLIPRLVQLHSDELYFRL